MGVWWDEFWIILLGLDLGFFGLVVNILSLLLFMLGGWWGSFEVFFGLRLFEIKM